MPKIFNPIVKPIFITTVLLSANNALRQVLTIQS